MIQRLTGFCGIMGSENYDSVLVNKVVRIFANITLLVE